MAYPTESVWGLGCDPYNRQAVERLLALKGRPVDKGLILLSGVIDHFSGLLENLTAEQRERFVAPGDRPTTWLLPDPKQTIPRWIKGSHEMVAVRVSSQASVMAMSRRYGRPLVSTSANPAGRQTASDRLALNRYFGSRQSRLDYILPGEVNKKAEPSRIINILTNDVIRP